MTQIQWAWLAGLLEGEGSFSRGCVRITSTDFDVLERVLTLTGLGAIYVPKPDARGGRKQHYVWSVSRKADARAVMEGVYPFMMERRRCQISPWIGSPDPFVR